MPAIDLRRAEAIRGWMTPRELRWLAEHAACATTIIEIGAFLGRSTRALADHCPGRVFTVDPWDGYQNDDGSQAAWATRLGGAWSSIQEQFHQHLGDHILSGRLVPIQQRSAAALPDLRRLGLEVADLVFIDGDHRYEACRRDIEQYRELLRPAGLLAGHDYTHRDWPGVKRAVDEVVGAVSLCDSIWWTVIP